MLVGLKKFVKKYLVRKVIYPVNIPYVDGHLLDGRVALITGSSDGIGFGIAEAFTKQGCKVIITGRNEQKLCDACRKLGGDVEYLVWDASEFKVIDSNFLKAVEKFGYIDILVNNAGYHGNQKFGTITESDFDNTFDVNVKQVFFLSQHFVKYLVQEKRTGNILNISSASSAKPAWSPYEISKWAVRGFTRGLAREVAQHGIIVNGIAPGPAASAMSHWKEGDPITWGLPSGRLAMPIEIGNLAVFLCSKLGENILGETVFCDGGSGWITQNR